MLVEKCKQNKDLIEQKNVLSSLCSRLFSSKNKLEFIINEHFPNPKQEIQTQSERIQLKEAKLKPLNKRSNSLKELNNDTFELIDAVDYSVSCSMVSVASSHSSKNDFYNTQLIRPKYGKIYLFRKVTIAIIAFHRLIYLVGINRNLKLSINDNHKIFNFRMLSSQNSTKTNSFRTLIRDSQFGNKSVQFSNEQNSNKSFFDWFKQSNEIGEFEQITELAEELNKLLFFDNSNTFLIIRHFKTFLRLCFPRQILLDQ